MKPPIVKPLQSHIPVTGGKDKALKNPKAALTSLCFINEPKYFEINDSDDDDSDDDMSFRTSQCNIRNSNVQNQLNITSNKMRILSSHANGDIYEWNLSNNSSKLWMSSQNAGMKLQYLSNQQSLLYHTRDANIKIYDLATKKVVHHRNQDVATIGFCSAIASKNSNNIMAYLKQKNNHNSIHIVDWKNPSQSMSLPIYNENPNYPNMCMSLCFVEPKIDNLSSSHVPVMISAGMEDGSVYIYDIRYPLKPLPTEGQYQSQKAPTPYLSAASSVTCMDILQNDLSAVSTHKTWTGILGLTPSPTINSEHEASSSTIATFQLTQNCQLDMQEIKNKDERIGHISRLSSKYLSTRIPQEKMGMNACRLISPNLCLLAGWDGRVRCFHIDPLKHYKLTPYGYIYPHYHTSVTCMDYSINSNILVTGTKDGSITAWPGPPPIL